MVKNGRHETGSWHVSGAPTFAGCIGRYHSKIVANNEARKASKELYREFMVWHPEKCKAPGKLWVAGSRFGYVAHA